MKIKYKILWIEDHPDQIQSAKNSLQRVLLKLGFELDVDARETMSNNDIQTLKDKLEIYNPYDLVIFDYDLGEGNATGAEIAQDLRLSIYTDMIFYSSNSVLAMRKDLFERHVDGVYVVSRTDLHDDASDIIKDQVKRICDLNNMRGVVLDEMSRLDSQLRTLLHQQFELLDEEKKIVQVNRLQKKLNKRGDDYHEDASNMTSVHFVKIISNPLKLDFGGICDRLASIKVFETLDASIVEKLRNLQRLRNELAHQKATLDEINGRIFLADSTEYCNGFDHAEFIKIRRDLQTISKAIHKLLPN